MAGWSVEPARGCGGVSSIVDLVDVDTHRVRSEIRLETKQGSLFEPDTNEALAIGSGDFRWQHA